ncbi:hypothetical protein [Bradyrhizobium japonicum]|uniref:hypothetical protein n=1 Tax=Bradyrhizobium japonicum TaxID=375 RepID=UPI000485B680|nr:hypothetical protein [Bradyrhizobium japonicum]WLB91329.1 hypothetical protein QIH91_13455 [Bradyrhizobium japonicum USDA 135]
MSEDEGQQPTPLTRQEGLAVMLDVVNLFIRLRTRMPASLVGTFLKAATNQGLSVSELAAKRAISGAVMSRHLGELGQRNRRGGAGLGLIAMVQEIHGDHRERRVYLTDKGVALLHRVLAAIKGEGPMAQQSRKPVSPRKPVTP